MKNLTASDRQSLIRLAASLPVGDENRRAILAGLKTAAEAGVTAIVRGGRRIEYSVDELREMVTPDGQISSMFKTSENLPRWLLVAGASKIFSSDQYYKLTGERWMENGGVKNRFPGGGWNLDRPSSWQKVGEILAGVLAKVEQGQHVTINVQSDDRLKNGIF